MRLGWAAPRPLKIINTTREKIEGFDAVTLTLEDNSQWQIKYFDETRHAKSWKVGEKVRLFIEDSKTLENPFLTAGYQSQYSYEIVNIDNAQHMAGEPAKMMTTQ